MSVEKARMNVRSVHRRVATGAPAGAHPQPVRVIHLPDEDPPGVHARPRSLHMASQAKVTVALGQQGPMGRPMRLMTNGTPLTKRLMFEDKRPRLLRMATLTSFVQTCPAQAPGGLGDIQAVRIVTGRAAHPPLQHGMS